MQKRFFGVVILGAALLCSALFTVLSSNDSQAALPRDCDNNAIIKCGAASAGELAQKYSQNQTGDLANVYKHYGISASMISAGGAMGEVHKDGRITLNGRTVATEAMSIGRQNIFSGSSTLSIAGKTYYNTSPSRSFARESIAAFVFLDQHGQFIGAILTSCGNPVTGKPPQKPKPQPSYKCTSLQATKLSRTEYSFTAAATASGGAQIVSYTYNFGDGASQTVPANTIKHTYQQLGNYTAKLTVNVRVGSQTLSATAPACQVIIPIKVEAAYRCDALAARLIKAEDRTYAYDLTYTVTGGAKLQSVDYDFGDGQGREDVSPEETKYVTHTYQKPGTYTTTATLHFVDGNGAVKEDTCQVMVTTNPEVCPQNPSLPKDDERCSPCPIPGKEQYPKDSPYCATPVTELPKTGPTDMIFGGLGIGSLFLAGYYWVGSRRDLWNTLLGR